MTSCEFPSTAKRMPFKNSKLVLKTDQPKRVIPSVYTQEMLQSTEERMANTKEVHLPRILELVDTSRTVNHKFSLVNMDQSLFQPYPSELVFQNFTPAQTYKLPLHLLNNDKVSQQIKLEPQDSHYFYVVTPKNAVSKVAPGMSATFTICFTPLENKDYHYSLVFVTERERFEVPVHAIGPRAILDFRDEFHLPTCPVKGSSERTHLVRNIGNSKACFALHTQRPFSVTPTSGTLDVFESMQVTVTFNPMMVGDHSQDLILHYNTGEDVYISLYGACEELSVHLEPDFVHLTKTYISLSTVNRTVSLINRSDLPLKYCWMTEEALSRTQQQCRSQSVQDLRQAFSHSCITVEPAEGEIWPNVPVELFIVFKPEEAKLYQETIYCDVIGRETRLPLTIIGEAMGPKLQLNYNVMDMNNVYIGSNSCYKVQLSNKGLIDAPFTVSKPDTSFGRCFSVSPEEGVVPPGSCQTLRVAFHSCILGTFSEDLLLVVTGQPDPLTLTFRGCVIGPTFNFSVLDLNFGVVAFGFPRTLSFTLFNTSSVTLKFALRVLGDGLGSPSVSYDKQMSNMSKNQWQVNAAKGLHAQPAEFTINPARGSVPSTSNVTIQVTLCANTLRTYRLALVVDVEGVGEEIRSLPIDAKCVVPDIVVDTPLLDFQRCFLNQPYEQKVCLINTSDLPACYGVLDQVEQESQSVQCYISKPKGVIYPDSSQEIPVCLMAKSTGTLHHTLRIAVFGSVQPPLEVILSCVGQGPIVHVQHPRLDFGKIQVLTDSIRTLQLWNQSPIPAHFTAQMSSSKSLWRVEPSEGEMSPGSQLELSVVAHLTDTLQFKDALKVSIQHGQTHTISLAATGTGTTIVSDRPFTPSIDLGTHFSPGSCQYHFKLTNRGRRTRLLYWLIDGFSSSTKMHKGGNISGQTILPPVSAPRKKDIVGQRSVLRSRKKPVFSLTPSNVELFPGCSVDMVLTGSSDSPKVVHERLVCRTIVVGQSSYEHILNVDVTCHFMASMLSISPQKIKFNVKKVSGESLSPVYEKLSLTSVSSRSLSLELSLVEPFSLCEAPGVYSSATTKCLSLGVGGQAELWICFNPAAYVDPVSQVVDEDLKIQYQGHTQQDVVKLQTEVHFPNLHFSQTTVDFGCVLNYTEAQRQIWMTNCSPLPVSYKWTFLEDHDHSTIREMKAAEEQSDPTDETDGSLSSSVSRQPGEDEHGGTQSTVFDILPSHGHLQPGEKQQVTVFFYAQENISRDVVAQCHVEDGPTYQMKLTGEAAVISYSLDSAHVDFGLQLFDREAEAQLTLRNTGKVGFKFNIVDPQREDEADQERKDQSEAQEDFEQQSDAFQQTSHKQKEQKWKIRPGQPTFIPRRGNIEAGAELRLRVLYLPGVPEVFKKKVQLKVAFLSVQDITLTGEGVFPRISLNLPQNLSAKCYTKVNQPARTTVDSGEVREELLNERTADGKAATEPSCKLTSANEQL